MYVHHCLHSQGQEINRITISYLTLKSNFSVIDTIVFISFKGAFNGQITVLLIVHEVMAE